MEVKNNLYGLYSPGSSGWTSLRNPEFQEADIWEVFQVPDPDSTLKRFPATTPARTIPKPNKTSDIYLKGPQKISQHSAAVNVPDWSKIYGSSDHANHRSWESKDDYPEEEGKWDEVIPPHEWTARNVSRSEMFSFSVCEGAGRTLKGRDLSRVRNAVLARTGFLEPSSRH